MAAPDFRLVRRPRGGPAALTAASQPLTSEVATKSFRSSMQVGSRTNWQLTSWDMYDLVGELRYYVGWIAASCSRCRLVPSEIDPITGQPTGTIRDDDPVGLMVAEIVRQIAGGFRGQSEYLKRSAEHLALVGETWTAVIDQGDGMPNKWYTLARDEVKTAGKKTTIELPTGDKYQINPGSDSLFRIWRGHPRKASAADSPVRAALDPLYEIVRTTKTIAKAANSRLIGNGIVLMPNSMTLPATSAPTSAGKPGDPPIPPQVGVSTPQRITDLIHQVASVAYRDPESMAALTPIMVGADSESIKHVQHLKFTDDVTDIALKTRADAIIRLATALDVSPERLLGLGGSTNHWSAWQITDQDVQLHIAPLMELIVQAIATEVLLPVFAEENIDPAKYTLWFDPSGLTADPDKTDDATDAFDRSVITAEAYRDFLGLGDTGYDWSTAEGWEQWAVDQIAKDYTSIRDLAPLVKPLKGVQFPALEPGGQGGGSADGKRSDTTNEGKSPKTENKGPGYDQGKRGRKESVGKSETAIVELLVSRALELAGKRRRDHSTHRQLPQGVLAHEVHRYLPSVAEDKIASLIKGWDDSVQDDVLASAGLDPFAVRREVTERVYRQLTAEVVDA